MAGTLPWEWDTWRDNRDALYTTAQALRAAADLEHAATISLNDPVAALNDVRPAAIAGQLASPDDDVGGASSSVKRCSRGGEASGLVKWRSLVQGAHPRRRSVNPGRHRSCQFWAAIGSAVGPRNADRHAAARVAISAARPGCCSQHPGIARLRSSPVLLVVVT